MTTKEIIKDGLEWMDAPIKAQKWRNRWFLKSSESFWGESIYASEGAAIEGAEETIKEDAENLNLLSHPEECEEVGRNFYVHEVSHYIPMPVGDA